MGYTPESGLSYHIACQGLEGKCLLPRVNAIPGFGIESTWEGGGVLPCCLGKGLGAAQPEFLRHNPHRLWTKAPREKKRERGEAERSRGLCKCLQLCMKRGVAKQPGRKRVLAGGSRRACRKWRFSSADTSSPRARSHTVLTDDELTS